MSNLLAIDMASLICKLYLRALVLLIWLLVSSLGQNLLSCETTSPDASGHRCSVNGSEDQCGSGTFAVLRSNSYYSSLSNLSFYLGLNRSFGALKPESLIPLTSRLIPLIGEPLLGSLAKPSEPNLHFPVNSIPIINSHKKKSRMWKVGVCIALIGVVVGAIIALSATFLVIQLKRKKEKNLSKDADVELQQLSLTALVDLYTIEELRKATEDFNRSNQIEGSVYHGRLNGKNLAIRRTRTENFSKVEIKFFNDATHRHPNIIRLLGTCVTGNSNLFLVFEYAKNGSLKDWLHGGLAMKNQFIASCYCFLTWKQRLRISLDVAVALQYMHQIMCPSYVHRNVKSRNIFLDEDFNAKIGNFGMARCVGDDTEYPDLSTDPATWSLGYLAPEYLYQGVISPGIDIFAYGIVLLEILSGQTTISRPDKKGGGNVWLSEKIKAILQPESADELREWMDSALGENYSFDTAVTLQILQ
ncbi:hypothetical protein CRYUN_Cryun15aG0009700 [Craigia yunnanensis]